MERLARSAHLKKGVIAAMTDRRVEPRRRSVGTFTRRSSCSTPFCPVHTRRRRGARLPVLLARLRRWTIERRVRTRIHVRARSSRRPPPPPPRPRASKCTSVRIMYFGHSPNTGEPSCSGFGCDPGRDPCGNTNTSPAFPRTRAATRNFGAAPPPTAHVTPRRLLFRRRRSSRTSSPSSSKDSDAESAASAGSKNVVAPPS